MSLFDLLKISDLSDILSSKISSPADSTYSAKICMLEIFPDELIENILCQLSCKQILELSKEFKRINNVCMKYNIIHKQKFKGFPRQTNNCKIHDVSNLIFKYEDDDDKYKIYEILGYFNDPLNVILDKLYELNYDLIRGDLICIKSIDYNIGIYVFDGCDMLKLENKLLPQQFTIINNDIPTNYWSSKIENVWFDHKFVKDELLANVKYEYNNNEYRDMLFTTFTLNNKKYVIYNEDSDIEDKILRKNKFVDDLSIDGKLLLYNGYLGNTSVLYLHDQTWEEYDCDDLQEYVIV